MTKRLLIWALAALGAVCNAEAQGNYPTGYANWTTNFGFSAEVRYVWDEVVQGKTGQGLGMIAPGAKRMVEKVTQDDGPGAEIVTEFYPNGRIKSRVDINGLETYHYDQQWRLQNITDKDGQVWARFFYDAKGRIVKTTTGGFVPKQYDYTYDANGNLVKIAEGSDQTFKVKNNQVVKIYWQDGENPTTYSYDENGKWNGSNNISLDGMDEPIWWQTKTTVRYNEQGFPSVFIQRNGEYSEAKKTFVGTPTTTNFRCTYTYDSKGNWTSWKVTGGYGAATITRTIEYYSDDEVKTAVAEMEAAKAGKKNEKKEKTEELWEF